jgi:hypothetical protein
MTWPHWPPASQPTPSKEWVLQSDCAARREFLALAIETSACGGRTPCTLSAEGTHRVTYRNRGGATVDIELHAQATAGLLFSSTNAASWTQTVTAPSRRDSRRSKEAAVIHTLNWATDDAATLGEIEFGFKVQYPNLRTPGSVRLTIRP